MIAEWLKSRHAFVHFDGDSWMNGFDPVEEADFQPTQQNFARMQNKPEPLATLFNNFVPSFQMMLSGQAFNEAALDEFYTAMAESINKTRAKYPGRDVIVTHAVFTKKVRDCLRRELGEDLETIILTMSPEILRHRVIDNLEAQAASQGITCEVFVHRLVPDGSKNFDQVVEEITQATRKQPEPVESDERGVCVVSVVDGILNMQAKVAGYLSITFEA